MNENPELYAKSAISPEAVVDARLYFLLTPISLHQQLRQFSVFSVTLSEVYPSPLSGPLPAHTKAIGDL